MILKTGMNSLWKYLLLLPNIFDSKLGQKSQFNLQRQCCKLPSGIWLLEDSPSLFSNLNASEFQGFGWRDPPPKKTLVYN